MALRDEYFSLCWISALFTVLFILTALIVHRMCIRHVRRLLHSVAIHGVLLLNVVFGFLMFADVENIPLSGVPERLLQIVFDDASNRIPLLISWILAIGLSVVFSVLVVSNIFRVRIVIARKFFHFIISFIFVTGIIMDIQWTFLCGWLWLCIFSIAETLRFLCVLPWDTMMDPIFLPLDDAENFDQLVISHITLLFGVFFPLLASKNSLRGAATLNHLSGMITIGFGDSIAAIIGTYFGKRRCSMMGKKTFEGSLAMFAACSTLFCLSNFCFDFKYSVYRIFLNCVVLTLLEACVPMFDNIFLGIAAYVMF